MPHACKHKRREYMRAYERKRSAQPLASDDTIRTLYSYDPNAGTIYKNGVALLGKTTKNGHLQIDVFGKKVMYHRLGWFLHHGAWPNELVDHINRDPSDNRITNLRLARPTDNQANGRLRYDNKLGIRGVSRSKNKFVARLHCNGRQVLNTYCDTLLDAVKARRNAVLQHCAEYASATEFTDTISALVRHGYGADDICYAMQITDPTMKQLIRAYVVGK